MYNYQLKIGLINEQLRINQFHEVVQLRRIFLFISYFVF